MTRSEKAPAACAEQTAGVLHIRKQFFFSSFSRASAYRCTVGPSPFSHCFTSSLSLYAMGSRLTARAFRRGSSSSKMCSRSAQTPAPVFEITPPYRRV